MSKLFDPKANAKVLLVLLAVAGLGWLLFRYTVGADRANKVLKTAVKARMDLHRGIENVQASSWKGLPIQLPYTGTVTMDIAVNRESISVYLIDATDVEAFRAANKKLFGGRFRHYPRFHAKKTKRTLVSSRLKKGQYYLILHNSTLGVLSSASVDVKVVMSLKP